MTLVIAEAGVNHNGDKLKAIDMIAAAAEAGADIVKFQTFKAENLVTAGAQQAKYQAKNTGNTESQLSMLSRLELGFDEHMELVECCERYGVKFLSTAFDSISLDFLVRSIGVETLKIPSGEITNAPLVLEHARTNSNLIVSTGMASLAEIENVLGVIAFGLIGQGEPDKSAFQQAYLSPEGQMALNDKVTLLHCTTEYPAPLEDINLNVMDTLRAAFKLPVGYSDHSEGITVPIAATAKGAVLIEKHFTLDKNLPGPDHKASLNPIELELMVKSIRQVESALGHGIKGPQCSEVKNIGVARKSLVATTDIRAGEIFTKENLNTKRPGNGMSPYCYWEQLGKTSKKDYQTGDLICE